MGWYANSMELCTVNTLYVPLYPVLATPVVLTLSVTFLTITVSPTVKLWGNSDLIEHIPVVDEELHVAINLGFLLNS